MRHALLLAVLLLAAPFVSAAPDDTCAIPIGDDYDCLLEAACAGCTDFGLWCTEQNGQLVDGETDYRCVDVCCCDGDSAYGGNTDPIARTTCSGYISAGCTDCQIRPPPTGALTCDDVCGGGGTTGNTWTVSGTVFDDDSGAGVATATIKYPLGDTLVTAFTNSAGSFTLPNVPEGPTNFKASKVGCGQDIIEELIVADRSDLAFHLNCATGGCTSAAVNDTEATPIRGERLVDITWSPSDCGVTQRITRCADDVVPCQIIGFPSPGDGVFHDHTVEPGKRYCYEISIFAADGTEIPQAVSVTENCVEPMDAYCLAGGVTSPSCFNDETENMPHGAVSSYTGSAHCNATNHLMIDEECGDGQACFFRNGQPVCEGTGHCDLCNGVLGWFVDNAARVLSGDSHTCADITGCILNNDGYAQDTYEPCDEIQSCYDYRSKDACEAGDGYDICGRSPTGCLWVDAPGMEELGKGVCVDPNEATTAPCEECRNVFGFCNEDLCEQTLGEGTRCYFNEFSYMTGPGAEPAAESCVAKETMACRYYDSQEDCEGGQQTSIDATYTGNERTGGEHTVIESADMFGFGTCVWDTSAFPDQGGYCYKDANGLRYDNGARIVDDCYEEGVELSPFTLGECFKDSTPPETSLPFESGEWLDASYFHTQGLRPFVWDNLFPADKLDTYFCLMPASSQTDCYPTVPWTSLVAENTGIQSYVIRYYSADPAGNLEEIQDITVNIDSNNETRLIQALLIS